MAAPRWLPPSMLLLVVVLFSAWPSAAGTLRFGLESGHTKYILDEIKVGSMAVGKYHVVNIDPSTPDALLPKTHHISLRVMSSYRNRMHYSENVQSGHFAFTAVEASDYLAYFWAPDHKPPVTITFEFDWRSGVRRWGRPTYRWRWRAAVALDDFSSFFCSIAVGLAPPFLLLWLAARR